MSKKIVLGIGLGAAAGIVDVTPMILQGLTWDANLSAFFLWMISGFFISVTTLKMQPILKGLLVSFLVLAPSAILIAWHNLASLIPIFVMTLILGSALGYSIDRFGRETHEKQFC